MIHIIARRLGVAYSTNVADHDKKLYSGYLYVSEHIDSIIIALRKCDNKWIHLEISGAVKPLAEFDSAEAAVAAVRLLE